MYVPGDGELIELEEAGARVFVLCGARRPPAADAVLRGLLAEDFVGVLEAVRRIGYEEVEFAGYHGRDPRAIRTLLDDLGLTAPAAHVGLDALRVPFEVGKRNGRELTARPFQPCELIRDDEVDAALLGKTLQARR